MIFQWLLQLTPEPPWAQLPYQDLIRMLKLKTLFLFWVKHRLIFRKRKEEVKVNRQKKEWNRNLSFYPPLIIWQCNRTYPKMIIITSWAEQSHARDQLLAFPPLLRLSYRIFLWAIIHVGVWVGGGWLDGLSENIASLASLRVSPLGRAWQLSQPKAG